MRELALDNKRIAVNTIILYVKLIITIIVSFVTSRLVLQALGESDYGLYNVVGGIVSMLNILGTSMVATSYRYMAVEIGKGRTGNPNKIFNTIFLIHLGLAIFLLIVGETLGVFYVKNYLNVEIEKIPDALFVLRLSLLTAAFAVIAVPSNGLIIAREKFLFISVVETISALLKICFVFALMYMDGNKLRFYAVFLAICQIFLPLCYQIYCRVNDSNIVKWSFNRDIQDYRTIISFTGWIFLGAVAVIAQSQGAAIVINHFFGTVLNAAFGLANQVHATVGQFTSTLRQAFIPQIIKNQQENEYRSLELVYSISRYSYLMMSVLSIPLMLNMRELLVLWLGNPPEYTGIFINYLLINGMIGNLKAGFDASIQATGKIRFNQIGYSIINLLLLPIMFVSYKLGCPPYANVIIMIVLTIVTVLFQCWIMKRITSFAVSDYIKETLLPALYTTVIILAPLLLMDHFMTQDVSFIVVIKVGVGIIWTIISVYLCGINSREKVVIHNLVSKLLKRN